MRTEQIVLVFVLLAVGCCGSSQQKLYYLYDQEPLRESPQLQQIRSNPYGISLLTINCQQKHCAKYKAPAAYPQLVFWNGPGCSYKTMQSPSLSALDLHFQKVNDNPIKPLRDFLERISLIEAFGVAFGFGTFLYIVFSSLFRDRSAEKAKKQ